jgi:hypothetical protein
MKHVGSLTLAPRCSHDDDVFERDVKLPGLEKRQVARKR